MAWCILDNVDILLYLEDRNVYRPVLKKQNCNFSSSEEPLKVISFFWVFNIFDPESDLTYKTEP